LSDASAAALVGHADKSCDLVFVAADGLSALAVQRHLIPLLEAMRSLLRDAWSVGPVVIAEQGRVAIGDEIGELLRARITVVLIGERPGLSSPDSLGIYLTFAPRLGRSDADRNCVSNVRPEGLSYDAAARRVIWLLNEASRNQLTGVGLKDHSELPKVQVNPGNSSSQVA
jgi:ethanolamine ammonia-lyase small subunit